MENIVTEYGCKSLFNSYSNNNNNIYKISKNTFNKTQYDDNKTYIIKVDCGVKSRKKNGLITGVNTVVTRI